MARLAIKGHPTRGKEVIEILEMLGGIGGNYKADFTSLLFFIGKANYITYDDIENSDNYILFTLEEFLEKFPYKVGDKVCFSDDPKHYLTIKKIWWNEDCNDLECTFHQDAIDVPVKDLQPYKEEAMKERESSIVVNNEYKQLKVHSLRFDKTQLMINDEYELKQEGNAYYIIRRKSQHPQTYEECCNNIPLSDCVKFARMIPNKLALLLENFSKLLICRDAYWKIAGEQMGLGKPWKPNYGNDCDTKYIITVARNEIYKDVSVIFNYFLIFPTEEMRDAFFDNFKDLIEDCKEFL